MGFTSPPARRAVLTGEENWESLNGDFQVSVYNPHEIVFSANCKEAVWLRLSEWSYPGWRAYLLQNDGREKQVKVHTSPEGLRTLALPAGNHTIRMCYEASWAGWILSTAAGIVFLAFMGLAIAFRTDWFWRIMQRFLGRVFLTLPPVNTLISSMVNSMSEPSSIITFTVLFT